MTPRQAECLGFIERYIDEHGYSPSYTEIGVGIKENSRAGIHRLVFALRDQGQIRMIPGRARSIVPVSHWTALFDAAKRVLDSIKKENQKTAVVGAPELGDLDIAVSELEALR